MDSVRGASARVPRHSRGRAKADRILEIAAKVIAEEGLSAVTMQDLVRRADSSVASMYYFFRDRESVLDALSKRHVAAIQKINQTLREVPVNHWRELSPAAAVERLMRPYISYLQNNLDFLPLMLDRASVSDDADFIQVLRHVLSARLPGIPPVERENYAAMLYAVSAGAIEVGFQVAPRRAEVYLRELPRVLTVYLANIEEAARQ